MSDLRSQHQPFLCALMALLVLLWAPFSLALVSPIAASHAIQEATALSAELSPPCLSQRAAASESDQAVAQLLDHGSDCCELGSGCWQCHFCAGLLPATPRECPRPVGSFSLAVVAQPQSTLFLLERPPKPH
ncbi:hypothetical protein V6U78_09860 [Marinospirillum sp. MEB164]|uniref:DUF2946 domain-containing protein n=1 Tax=Marinospirillum alkalitolerans TaxID=3123374 RepID=A0ABW8PYI3_9GAMM